MSVQNRTTLKSYFMMGATLDESDFADLIDSSLIVEDLVTGLTSSSTVKPLSASAGSELNTKISDLMGRVTTLEGGEASFAQGYYDKAEVDNLLVAVDTTINGLPFAGQINNLEADITSLTAQVGDRAGLVHNHTIADITGLQADLDLRASITELNSIRDSLMDSITNIELSDETEEVAALQSAIDDINIALQGLATKNELASLVGPDHDHVLDDIIDLNFLNDYFTKTEVNSMLETISYAPHNHDHTEIDGLGGEIQSKTNLLVQDHTALKDNPHDVTKSQVGLDKVENLTPSEMVAAGGGLPSGINEHIASTSNPHSVSKTDVGLDLVPNVNVLELFNQHIAESNPHNITLSSFDIYTTSEADQKIQDYINALRYNFTPAGNTDATGHQGDFAYDSENLYFKISSTDWTKIPLGPVFSEEVVEVEQTSSLTPEEILQNSTPVQKPATQEDVDAGLATSVGETITTVTEVVTNTKTEQELAESAVPVEQVATQEDVDNGFATSVGETIVTVTEVIENSVSNQDIIDNAVPVKQTATQEDVDLGLATSVGEEIITITEIETNSKTDQEIIEEAIPVQQTATQEDVDLGLATSVGETIVTVTEIVADSKTEQELIDNVIPIQETATQEDVDLGLATTVGETIVIVKEVGGVERLATSQEQAGTIAEEVVATQDDVDAGLAVSVGETIVKIEEPVERIATTQETTNKPVAQESTATQDDVDSGLATQVGEVIVKVDEPTERLATSGEVSNVLIAEESLATQEDVDSGLATSVGEAIVTTKENQERVATEVEKAGNVAQESTATQDDVDAGLATSVGETIVVIQEEEKRAATAVETTGPVAVEQTATQEDVDNGLATSVGETITTLTETVEETVRSNVVSFNVGEVEAMRIDEALNVGIGIDEPAAKLDVNGDVKVSTTLDVGSDVTVRGNLNVYGATNTINSTTLQVDDKIIELASTDSPTDATADGGGLVVKGTTDKSILWTTAGWQISGGDLSILGGNLSISGGSFRPVVEVDTSYTQSVPNLTSSVISVTNNPTTEAENNHATLQFNLKALTHNHIASISLVSESATLRKGALAFCTDNGTTRPEAMRITSSGKVGIKNTNPGAALDVGGVIESTNMVRAQGWFTGDTSMHGLATEMGVSSGFGYIMCYDRSIGEYGDLRIQTNGSGLYLTLTGEAQLWGNRVKCYPSQIDAIQENERGKDLSVATKQDILDAIAQLKNELYSHG